jgi:hypothetical protein
MKLTIKIDRPQEIGEEEKKKEKEILKSLAATEFPLGIMKTPDEDPTRNLLFSGTVEDFVKAAIIKRVFLASDKSIESKKQMTAKLTEIPNEANSDT